MPIVPIVPGLIFILLYLAFSSVKLALLVVGNIPLALVGGITALWLRGMDLNLSASIGFIALFGVAMLNGVRRGRTARKSRGTSIEGSDMMRAFLGGSP